MFNIDRFEDLIQETGVTKASICAKLGRSRSFFTDVKKGKQSPKQEEISIIASCLNCSVDYLLGKTDIKKAPTVNNDGDPIDEDILSIAKILQKAPPEQIQLIKTFVQSLQPQNEKNE